MVFVWIHEKSLKKCISTYLLTTIKSNTVKKLVQHISLKLYAVNHGFKKATRRRNQHFSRLENKNYHINFVFNKKF